MSIFIKDTLKYGNLRKGVVMEILPHEVWCPICESYVDGNINDLDEYRIEPSCGCDREELDQKINDLNDEIVGLEQDVDDFKQDIHDLNDEVARLKQELFDAQQ